MVEHVNKICKTSYYHLRNISKIRKYLTEETTEILVHAFVTSKLDYCNSLLYGLPKHIIGSLQSVQNTAARIVTLTKKFDHITPVLIQLHWLPVHFRILFKVLLLVYKALNGMAPLYIICWVDWLGVNCRWPKCWGSQSSFDDKHTLLYEVNTLQLMYSTRCQHFTLGSLYQIVTFAALFIKSYSLLNSSTSLGKKGSRYWIPHHDSQKQVRIRFVPIDFSIFFEAVRKDISL